MADTSADDAVRNYIRAVRDPASIIDYDKVKRLTRRLQERLDPQERLRLGEELVAAREPDLRQLEAEFISVAKGWADANGRTAVGFVLAGVSYETLRKAGFDVKALPRKILDELAAQVKPPATSRRTARRRMERRDLVPYIPEAGTAFTVSGLAAVAGCSRGLVRRLVEDGLERGVFTEAGRDPHHVGAGRPAVQFTVSDGQEGALASLAVSG